MKTIEERATDAGILSQYMAEYPYDKRSVELGYVAGAYDQKAIDIDKACKACENELRELKRLLDESVGIPASLMSVGKSLSAIRREMEESLWKQ